MWVDTHTHLNFDAFEGDFREVVERAVKAGVSKMVVVGTDLVSSRRAVKMAKEHPALYAAVGVHPHHARGMEGLGSVIDDLRELVGNERVVAIGEVGLDYHVYKGSKYSEEELKVSEELKVRQRELLEAQVELAEEFDKPLIIHSREAGEEVLEVVRGATGVFHCFEGSRKYLKRVLRAGFYVSFTGQITYVKDRAEVAREVPLERLLSETDCPYMKPFREKLRCEPADVTIIGQFQAEQRGIELAEVEEITTANARRLFKL